MTGSNIWDQVLARIETKVNRHSYYTWFKPTSFVSDDDGTHHRPGSQPADQRLADEALRGHPRRGPDRGPPSRCPPPFSPTDDPAAPARCPNRSPPSVPERRRAARRAPGGLASPRYTFDTFIVGASNQFAHAACRAVAEAPSRSYNPLFIYGGVGLGKTHLMHAIGHYVLTHRPALKLTYISSERFMNEMINAIRYDRILEFRERYRSVDVLLVDDIQFIVGKERTQTEFFHTFNALHDAQKQIVLSSDCPPHQIHAARRAAASAVRMGADRRHPAAGSRDEDRDSEAKSREPKACPLPDNVAIYIAGRIKSNIRELEGSLIRLLAYASLTRPRDHDSRWRRKCCGTCSSTKTAR